MYRTTEKPTSRTVTIRRIFKFIQMCLIASKSHADSFHHNEQRAAEKNIHGFKKKQQARRLWIKC